MSDLNQIKELLKKALERKNQGVEEELRKALTATVGADLVAALLPVLKVMAGDKASLVEELKQAISEIQVNADLPDINIPEIKIPEIKLPDFPKIPTPIVNVKVPDINIPDIKMPEEMEIKGWVNMMGFDKGFYLNPLPVQIRDAKGNPLNMNALIAALKGSSNSGAPMGSGKTDFFKLNYTTADPLPVTIASGANTTSASAIVDSTGVQYSGSNPVPVAIISGAAAGTSVSLVNANGDNYNSAIPLPVQLYANTSPLSSGGTGDGTTVSQSLAVILYALNAAGSMDRLHNHSGEGNALRVQMATDAVASVYVTGYGATSVSYLGDRSGVSYDGSNPLPVSIITGAGATSAAAIVDSTGAQYSGSNPIPVSIISGAASTSASNIVDSTGVAYSGSNPIPQYQATQPTFTAAVVLEDSGGSQYSGSNPIPVVLAAGSNNTVAAAIVDSTGIEYSGSNPLPITLVSGALTSTIVVGPNVQGVADDNSAPLQHGGIARTTNPGKVTDGQVVKAQFDPVGRQVMRPLQVRGLLATAYATFATGTEATLRAGVPGVFLDLVYIMASNNSDAAVAVDIRQVTAGGVIMTLQVPANGVAGVSLPVALPQQDTGNNWTADLPDITGTTVSISAMFTQEV